MNFKAGQKVRCIDAADYPRDDTLTEGKVYEVIKLVGGFDIQIIGDHGKEACCLVNRFEAVEEDSVAPLKVDIERVGSVAKVTICGNLTKTQINSILEVLYA
jgi:hypothetical protein